ncbi:MAG: hypothetical protein IJW55_07660 [Clostridia bacterium]|nr:hypothetical protein [Clostridia bacterium]
MADRVEAIIKLTLDTFRENRVQEPVVTQYDYGSRFMDVTMTTMGVFQPIPSTALVLINVTRADGESDSFSGEVNADGTVRVPINQWMTALDDRVKYTVSAITDKRLSTTPSTFLVKASPNQTDTPSEGTEEADLLAEVLYHENVRQASEAERVANEDERMANEKARVTAEAQRITDEQTRIDNETARVEAEATREIKFNSWEADIASLPSFDARITANSKRISNIEAGLPADRWAVDSTTAYQKDVPANALPYAAVSKIGGMTRKCANLLNLADTKYPAGGVTATVKDQTISFSGVATVETWNILGSITLTAGDYTFSCAQTMATGVNFYIFSSGNYTSIKNTRPTSTLTVTETTTFNVIVQITDLVNDSSTLGTYNLMLNEGTAALPYEAYFDGLRDAPVTEVESVGANLINFGDSFTKSHSSKPATLEYDKESDTFTFSCEELTAGIDIFVSLQNKITPIAGENYTLSIEDITSPGEKLGFYFGLMDIRYPYREGTYSILTKSTLTGTFVNDAEITHLKIFAGPISATNTRFRVTFNKGSDALPYTPYAGHTLSIPEAVQALDGYGQGIDDTYHNFIDWRPEDGVTEFRKDVNRVVLTGGESWQVGVVSPNNTEYNRYICFLYRSRALTTKICSHFNYLGDNISAYNPNGEGLGNGASVDTIYPLDFAFRKDGQFPTVEDFKSFLAQQYEMGTPVTVDFANIKTEVTDISDLLPADNLIEVEGGGTLTFVNEYSYDVPSTVTYQLDLNAETAEEVNA